MKGFTLVKNYSTATTVIRNSSSTNGMNRAHYSTDEEEFDLNEGFVEPYSIILKAPIKRKRL